jgi:CBS domain-containing protein
MLTAADVMTARPVVVTVAATVAEAIRTMQERGISSVLVAPAVGAADYGIVTMRDVVTKIVTEGFDPDTLTVGDIMTWRLVTARPQWPLRRVAEVMAQARVRRLPVVEDSALVGVVSDTDLFTALVPRHDWEHVRRVRKERALRRARRSGPAKTAGDIMSAPVLTIDREATVQAAVRKMVAAGISSLLVADVPGGGILTKRDVVLKVVAAGGDPARTTVGVLMSAPVRTVEIDTTIEECSRRMGVLRVRRFPVTRAGETVGIVSDSDILAAVAGHRWLGRRPGPTAAIAADVMRPSAPAPPAVGAEALTPELSIWECAARLARAGARELPVVQQGRIIGVVGEADILRALEERGGPD